MDLLTTQDLREIADRSSSPPSVSMFMPTHRFGNDTAADRVRWKNLLSATTNALGERAIGRRAIDELLGPATALLDDAMAWQYMSDGLAVHLQSGWHQVLRVPFALPEVAVVGDRPAVGPLVQAINRGGHFLVLTLSQRHVRLLEATADTIEEVELSDVPTELREVVEAPETRSDAMARSLAGGSSGPAVFYGHGAADDDFKTQETTKFFRQVDHGLHQELEHHDLPLVLVGLEPATAIYREISSYPHLTDAAVHHNPDQMTPDQILTAAWPVVAERFEKARAALAERFEAHHGTGLASTEPDKIEQAAEEGRVETLFAATDPWGWQTDTTNGPTVVELHSDPSAANGEVFGRLERTLVATMAARGDVVTVDGEAAPGGGSVAAMFRY